MPTNSTITIHKQTVLIHPIIDEYYNQSPSYSRSNNFAVSKGLVSHAPGVTQSLVAGNAESNDARHGGAEEVLREKLEGLRT